MFVAISPSFRELRFTLLGLAFVPLMTSVHWTHANNKTNDDDDDVYSCVSIFVPVDQRSRSQQEPSGQSGMIEDKRIFGRLGSFQNFREGFSGTLNQCQLNFTKKRKKPTSQHEYPIHRLRSLCSLPGIQRLGVQ